MVGSGSRLYSAWRMPVPGAHHLHVAGLGAALVAEAVLVGDRALAHVGDDLHVGVRVRRKAGVRRDLVVVPDPQRAPAHPLGVVIVGEGEMMLGLQPAVVGAAELVEGLRSIIGALPGSGPRCFAESTMDSEQIRNRNYRNSLFPN